MDDDDFYYLFPDSPPEDFQSSFNEYDYQDAFVFDTNDLDTRELNSKEQHSEQDQLSSQQLTLPLQEPQPQQLQQPPRQLQKIVDPSVGHLSGIPCGAFNKMGDRFHTQDQLKEYLQFLISGDKKIRFKKEKLFYLFDIFVMMFGWVPLNRKEKRNKKLVFKRLFENKNVVVECIERFPSIIDQVLLYEGKVTK